MLPCSRMLRVLEQLIVCHWHYSLWVRPLKYDENQFIGAWSTPNYMTQPEWESFLVASCKFAVNSGYDRGERCLSAVFFAMLTCWHVQFSKVFAFLFFSINQLLFLDKIGFARKSRVYKTVTKRPRFSDNNIASSVWKSTTDSKHLTINHVIFSYLQNHQHWDILVFSKVLSLKLGKAPSSRQQFYFALYSPSSAVNITS